MLTEKGKTMSILINGLDMPSDDGELVEVLIFGDGHVVQTGDSFKAEDGRFYYKPCDWKYLTAVPVKHGEWIHGREVSRDYVGDACVCIHYEKWWCSECNYTVDLGEPLWHYCPNCGAKMDGERRDDAVDH